MPQSVEELVESDAARPAPQDKLDTIRLLGEELRDCTKKADDLAEAQRENNTRMNDLKFKALPEAMIAARIDRLGIEAKGNLPTCDLLMKPYYKANISAEWPEDQRKIAFAFLEKKGHKDIIKTEFVVLLPRGDRKFAVKVRSALKKLKVEFTEAPSVPWNTLTALVKEQSEKNRPFSPDELKTLGATVGRVVELKERKLT